MCYEKYTRYICGCRDVESTLCDLAEAVDHPFWLKLSCLNYSNDHLAPATACSLRFYCAKSRDAEYINDLWRRGENAIGELNRIIELERLLTGMLEDARRKNVPDNVCKGHDQFKAMSYELRFRCQFDRRNRLLYECSVLKQYIHEVKQFYDRYGAPNTPDRVFSQTPSFVDTVGRRIASSVTSKPIDVRRSRTPSRSSEGDYLTVHPHKSAPPAHTYARYNEVIVQPTARQRPVTERDTPVKHGRKSVSPARDEVQEENRTVRRSARVSKKNVNYGESDGSSPARAPSPGESDVSGFDPSNKSDTSGSPERSQPKRKRSRPSLQSQSSGLAGRGLSDHSTSIGSKLNEYRERMSRVSLPGDGRKEHEIPTMSPSIDEATKTIYQIPAGLQDHQGSRAAQTYRVPTASSMLSSSRPPTRYGPPSQHGLGNQGINNFTQQPPAVPNFLPKQKPQQSSPLSMPANIVPISKLASNLNSQNSGQNSVNSNSQQVGRSWLMNTSMQPVAEAPAGTPTTADDEAVPLQRVDSTTEDTTLRGSTAQVGNMPTESPYDRMRRSFSATADLPSPAVTEASPPTTDPKKRKQPVSSPVQPSNQRLRLSLPGDSQPNNSTNNTPAALDQALSMSSPSKMQSQKHSFDAATVLDHDDPPPTPAPNLAPTAVMYKPSQVEIHAEYPSDGLEIYLGLPSSVMQAEGMGYGDEEDDMLFGDFTNEELPFLID